MARDVIELKREEPAACPQNLFDQSKPTTPAAAMMNSGFTRAATDRRRR
jgi:hypothetical protein